MKYIELCEVYKALDSTTKRLEKTEIIAKFLRKLHKESKNVNDDWIFLLRGRVLPEYDPREFGMSGQLLIKVIAKSSGVSSEKIVKMFNEVGDLGEVAERVMEHKKQSTLSSSTLSVEKVFENLRKLFSLEGKGSVDKKVSLVSELLGNARGIEAKYLIRTVLNDLRIGVADSTIRDGISEAFFPDDKKEMSKAIEWAYDLSNDFSEIFSAVVKGKKELAKINLSPGKPMNVMLAVKAVDIPDAFRICGKPAAIEYKYDGFRVVINKDKNGEVKLFTRRLEEVTNQFPDVVEVVNKNVKAKNFILDSEIVGYDKKTKKYRPFEAISQRIKRKHHIEKLVEDLPVEINVFDVMYLDGKSTMDLPFKKRRKIIEKIIKNEKLKIRVASQIITDSEKKAQDFYDESMNAGEEGIMVKNIEVPYHPGRRVGYMVKMKPNTKDLDLVIVGAEHGNGKRAGWLTSYIVACRDEKNPGKFLEIGKVSSGLKEKEGIGTSYMEMTNLLKPLIEKESGRIIRVKPKIVVSVTYQNIQKSPSYSSGYALRFPRITNYRPDRGTKDIASLKDIMKLVGV